MSLRRVANQPEVHDLRSRSNRQRIAVWTSTPEGDGPFPALVLLQGVAAAGGHGWWIRGRAHETVAALQSAGFESPPVLIMPADTGTEMGTAWCDWKDGTTKAETWLVDELMPWIPDELPVDDRRWVTGLSTGAYGGFRAALRHPGLYSSATGMSTVIHPLEMAQFVPMDHKRIWGNRRQIAREDLRVMIQDSSARSDLRFALDCGAEDPMARANETLHNELVASGVEHGYRTRPGGHTWDFWQSGLADHIRFHARVPNGLESARA